MAEVAHHGVVQEVEPGILDGLVGHGVACSLSVDLGEACKLILRADVAAEGTGDGDVGGTVLGLAVLPDTEGEEIGVEYIGLKLVLGVLGFGEGGEDVAGILPGGYEDVNPGAFIFGAVGDV